MEKSFAVGEIKTMGEAGSGQFEAIVSVFGNIDHVNDRVLSGAFEKAIKESPPPPVVWSHHWSVPPIGNTLDWAEQDKGLWVKGELFVGADDNHMYADMTYAAMKDRGGGRVPALREFSFSYDIPDGGADKKSEDVDGQTVVVRELKELFPIHEVGPCMRGCNPATELVAAPKSIGAEGFSRLERLALKREIPMAELLKQIEEHFDPAGDVDDQGNVVVPHRYSPEVARQILAALG